MRRIADGCHVDQRCVGLLKARRCRCQWVRQRQLESITNSKGTNVSATARRLLTGWACGIRQDRVIAAGGESQGADFVD